jgi:hypothetical protein
VPDEFDICSIFFVRHFHFRHSNVAPFLSQTLLKCHSILLTSSTGGPSTPRSSTDYFPDEQVQRVQRVQRAQRAQRVQLHSSVPRVQLPQNVSTLNKYVQLT